MKSLSHSGELVLPRPMPTRDEYADLKQRIKQAGLLSKEPQYYVWTVLITLAAIVVSFTVVVVVHNMWWQLLNAALLGLVFAQVGYLGHDAGHRQPFSRTWKNEWAGLISGNLFMGMCNGWWVDKHNKHHSHPNQLDLDPDLDIPGICFNLIEAREKRGVERWILLHQVWLFFPMLLLVAFSQKKTGTVFLLKNWREVKHPVVEAVLIVAHWGLFLWFLMANLGIWQAVVFFLLNQFVLGFVLGSAFAPNHKGMPVLEKDSELSFLHRQVLTARNIHAGAFTDVWYGGLNYQIEHHLFPSMPRKHLRAAQLLVKEFCHEHEIPYEETSILGSYQALVEVLAEISTTVRQEQS